MKTAKTKVSIIGGGAIGQALAHILKKNPAAEAFIYDTVPSKTHSSLLQIVSRADMLFFCVPSWAMRKAIINAKPYLNKETPVISLAKGIEKKGKKTMDALLAELLPKSPIGILGGPMLAAEFMTNQPSVGYFASPHSAVRKRISKLFSGTLLSIEATDDIRGAALAGTLKNIYALGLGIAAALSWGNNEKGWLVAHATAEMADIIALLGGRRETAYSLAGLGDLVATGLSPHSKNSRAGAEIALHGICNHESEGCASLPFMDELLRKERGSFQIFCALESIILRGADAKTEFARIIFSERAPIS